MGPDYTSVVVQPSPQGEGMGIFVSTRQRDAVVNVVHMRKGHIITFHTAESPTALQMLVLDPQIACI